jgi:hypothetical protein
MEKIVDFLGFGSLGFSHNNTVCRLRVTSLSNINKFISLIKDSGFLGAKALDYADFCKGINLINNKTHLTKEGITIIKGLTANMNSSRTIFE